MRYLVVQDWSSTHGNHAGMVHMCRLLQQKFPQEYKVIIRPSSEDQPKYRNILAVKIQYHWNYPISYLWLCKEMLWKLKGSDEIFLLEYLYTGVSQKELAYCIRALNRNVKIYALSHLTPKTLSAISDKYILSWTKPIDKMLTLGSSLSSYFNNRGVDINKISTGFHYVDNSYYIPKHKEKSDKSTFIVIGAMQRDFGLVASIVKRIPNASWKICCGRKKLDSYFADIDNVELLGYMDEDELLRQMQQSDISLSVMNDTVGSNVITTSMAVGLAMVVSDVGSIRDYCDDTNAVFCNNNVEDFVTKIYELLSNPARIESMKVSSLSKSEAFNIENVHKWFNTL